MKCKFCQIPSEEIITETKTSIIRLGSQLHEGHTQIVFKRHVENIHDLSEEEFIEFSKDLRNAAKAVKIALNPDKMNYALYGNWEPHLHWHIYPRYKNKPDFGQPPHLKWKVNGKRVNPPKLEDFTASPMNETDKKSLKEQLRKLL
ncbi:MAG: HIT family protein [Candidatus Altiarchaeota archaeon]|nr:HIT family protein [Candidatus Altiarchaeota archaeon]